MSYLFHAAVFQLESRHINHFNLFLLGLEGITHHLLCPTLCMIMLLTNSQLTGNKINEKRLIGQIHWAYATYITQVFQYYIFGAGLYTGKKLLFYTHLLL